MFFVLNGQKMHVQENLTYKEFAKDYDLFVRNGYAISVDEPIRQGDNVIAIKKNQPLSPDTLEELIACRNGEFVTSKLQNAKVCVCGLGGLGSHIVAMLVRLGIKNLKIVDFDVVDITNINRQNYFLQDVGKKKTQATLEIAKNINPFANIECVDAFVDENNLLDIVGDCEIVVEAFDNKLSKATLANTLLEKTDKWVVASSGMAGYDSANQIKSKKIFKKLVVCGDMQTEAQEGVSLLAPRVMICAGHQANAVLRILLGLGEEI